MLREFQGDRNVLFDNQQREAGAVQRAQGVAKLVDDRRREAQRELVDQQQARRAHEAAGDRAHLLLAARKRAGVLVAALGEDREHRVHALEIRGDCAGAVGAQVGAHEQVVADAHGREEPPSLGHVGDACRQHFVGLGRRQFLPIEPDRPAGGAHDARNRSHQRGLAGAIGADQAGDLACLDGKLHAPKHRHVAIPGVHAGNFEQRLSHWPPLLLRSAGPGRPGSRADRARSFPACPKRSARRDGARRCGCKATARPS